MAKETTKELKSIEDLKGLQAFHAKKCGNSTANLQMKLGALSLADLKRLGEKVGAEINGKDKTSICKLIAQQVKAEEKEPSKSKKTNGKQSKIENGKSKEEKRESRTDWPIVLEKYEKLITPMTEIQYAQFKADIAEKGIKTAISVTINREVLDGHHRIKAAQELGIPLENVPIEVRGDLDTEEKRLDFIYVSNISRRHNEAVSALPLAKKLAAKVKEEVEAGRKEKRAQKKDDPEAKIEPGKRTNEIVAESIGMSPSSYANSQRVEKYAVQALGEKRGTKLIEDMHTGKKAGGVSVNSALKTVNAALKEKEIEKAKKEGREVPKSPPKPMEKLVLTIQKKWLKTIKPFYEEQCGQKLEDDALISSLDKEDLEFFQYLTDLAEKLHEQGK